MGFSATNALFASEQKVCASSWTLLREFAKKYREREEELKAAAEPGKPIPEPDLPMISYYEARQIMTRADFIDSALLQRF